MTCMMHAITAIELRNAADPILHSPNQITGELRHPELKRQGQMPVLVRPETSYHSSLEKAAGHPFKPSAANASYFGTR